MSETNSDNNFMGNALKSSYEAVRNEIILRVRIRTQVIGFFVVGAGTICSYLVSQPVPELLVVISFFSLAMSLMVVHQDFSITEAADFCKKSIKPLYGKNVLWNNCATENGRAKKKRRLRFYSQLAIFLFPPVVSYIYIASQPEMLPYKSFVFTWYSLIPACMAVCVWYLLFRSMRSREKRMSEINE